jgi:nicotinate-nucleotide pyrophosphorylase (carboxylating)
MEKIVQNALEEDLGRGDITAAAIVADRVVAEAVFISHSSGIIAGLEVAAAVFRLLDSGVSMDTSVKDGGKIVPETVFARVRGQARALLSAERVALNFLQHLSGIATATSMVVDAVKPYPVRVVDTRKTTPGLRVLEKYAVRVGGGFNHRMGLDDAVLIKDNHLELAGGVAKAIELIRQNVGHMTKIEVEVETLDQVKEALAAGVDVIMLDNMDSQTMKKAVSLIGKRALVEASGNITIANAGEIAATGVDILSLGWITHSAPPLDISMEALHHHFSSANRTG